MRRTIVAAGLAALIAAPQARAQSLEAVLEQERIVAGSNGLLAQHRDDTQRNIDKATRALQQRDYPKARRYARIVVRQDPKRVEAWLLLGAAQLGVEDWKQAKIAYGKAVRLSPPHAEARAGLGVALARAGDPKAAEQLAWLSERLRACGGCGDANRLARFKADVEAALAHEAPRAG